MDVCNVPGVVGCIMATMYDDSIVTTGLFEPMRLQMERNLATAAGLTLEEAKRKPSAIVRPDESKLPTPQLVSTYLFATPFEQLFSLKLPFDIPEALRFEHMHILAGSGPRQDPDAPASHPRRPTAAETRPGSSSSTARAT